MNKKILLLSCVLIQGCFAADGGGGAAGRPAGVDAGTGARGGLDPQALVRALAQGGIADSLRVRAIPLESSDDDSGVAPRVGRLSRRRAHSAGALRPGRNGRSEFSRVGAAGHSKSLSRSRRARSTSAQRAARRVLQGLGRSPEHIARVFSERLPSPVRRTRSQVAAARSRVIPSDLIAASHRRAPSAWAAAAAGAYPGDGAGDAGGSGRAGSRSHDISHVAGGSSAACGGPAAVAGARSAAGRTVGLGGLPAGILEHIADFAGPAAAGQLSLTSRSLNHAFTGYPGLGWSRATWCRTIDLTSFNSGTIESFELKPLEGEQFAFSMGVKQGRCCRPQNQKYVGIFNWSSGQSFLLQNMRCFESKDFCQYDFSSNSDLLVQSPFLGAEQARPRFQEGFAVYRNSALLFDQATKDLVSSVALPYRCKVVISGNGQYVATRGHDRPFSIYNVISGAIIRTLPIRQFVRPAFLGNFYKAALSFDGTRVAELVDNILFISDANSGDLLQQFDDLGWSDVEFSRCGRFVFGVKPRGRRYNLYEFKIINIQNRQVVYSFEEQFFNSSNAAASPCGNYVAVFRHIKQEDVGFVPTLQIIDVHSNQCVKEFKRDPVSSPVNAVSIKFSSCGNYLMVYDQYNARKIQILKKGGHSLPPDFVPDAPRCGADAGGGAGGGAAGDGCGPAAAAGPH